MNRFFTVNVIFYFQARLCLDFSQCLHMNVESRHSRGTGVAGVAIKYIQVCCTVMSQKSSHHEEGKCAQTHKFRQMDSVGPTPCFISSRVEAECHRGIIAVNPNKGLTLQLMKMLVISLCILQLSLDIKSMVVTLVIFMDIHIHFNSEIQPASNTSCGVSDVLYW